MTDGSEMDFEEAGGARLRMALATIRTDIDEAFERLLVPHAIRNRTAYVQAQDAGVSLTEIKTRSGREAVAEFTAFFDWFYKIL